MHEGRISRVSLLGRVWPNVTTKALYDGSFARVIYVGGKVLPNRSPPLTIIFRLVYYTKKRNNTCWEFIVSYGS